MKSTRSLLLALTLAASAHAAAPPAAVAPPQLEALAQDPYWHRLLHYRPNRLLPGHTSVIDSEDFFLAPDGRTDPRGELEATLAAMRENRTVRDEPAACRFRARYEWLRERLGEFAPRPSCTLYEGWSGAAAPGRAHIVFASSDLGSPATMYGHTLLRIDAAGSADPLLSLAVSYAATVAPDVGALSYMARGLGGGFVGSFSVMPYHQKVREYARIDERDLWEYPLNLAPDEIRRVLWHLWELRDVGSDYYFLSENCSYMLLALLDTARPGLTMAEEFDDPAPYTIPLDTIRVLRDQGLTGEPFYRASQMRRLHTHLKQLPPESRAWAADYAHGAATLEDPRLPGAAEAQLRARALETAAEYLAMTARPKSQAEAIGLPRPLLLERSRLDVSAGFREPPRPAAPDVGHESSRLDSGARHAGGRTAGLLRARGAYHDRLDPPRGYLAGGELEFATAQLLVSEGEVQLSEVNLVNIAALAPWRDGFHPLSWQAAFGARRFGLDAVAARAQQALGGFGEAGLGATFNPVEPLFVYGLVFGSADGNRDVEDGYALAGGVRTGLAWQPAAGWAHQLEVEALDALDGGAAPRRALRAGSNIPLGPRDGLRLNFSHLDFDGVDIQTVELRWLRYF